MNHYAQINGDNICIAILQTTGLVNAAHMVPIDPEEAHIGQRWTGDRWETVPPTPAELAALELAEIDAKTGMTRTLRETLIAISDKVGVGNVFLKEQEAKAVAARLRLKG